jgi:hypothetical protein
MELTLKLDPETQQAVIQDGKPVYILTDGDKSEDFVADVPSMYLNTLKLKGESKQHRDKLKSATDELTTFKTIFDGVEDVAEYRSAADKALEVVKNLDDKKLIDAGKVDEVKAELKAAHDKNLAAAQKKFEKQLEDMTGQLGSKDNLIRKLTIGQRFATDQHFSGTEPKTNVQPAMAEAYWGHLFTVDEKKTTADGKPLVIGHHPVTGDEILSTRPDTVGEIADFGEAISVVIEHSPLRDAILNSGPPGSGAGGGGGGGGGGSDELSKLKAKYDAAVKSGDGRTAVALKNRIFAMQQGTAGRTAQRR